MTCLLRETMHRPASLAATRCRPNVAAAEVRGVSLLLRLRLRLLRFSGKEDGSAQAKLAWELLKQNNPGPPLLARPKGWGRVSRSFASQPLLTQMQHKLLYSTTGIIPITTIKPSSTLSLV